MRLRLLPLALLAAPLAAQQPVADRYRDVARQLVHRVVTRHDFAYGVRRFVVGLGKKVLIANTLAVPVDKIFLIPFDQLTPGLAWLGLYGFTMQLYFDFSGYSDMAIGLGRMMGFRFKENFRYPFMSASATEYFQRWHISLNTWLRDYPYRALGGSRGSAFRVYFNIIFLLILCGLWHGAQWSFIVWGLINGIFLAIQRYMVRNQVPVPVPRLLMWAFCFFCFIVSMAFFRSLSLTQSLVFVTNSFGFSSGDGSIYYPGLYLNARVIVCLLVATLGSFPVVPLFSGVFQRYRGSCSVSLGPYVDWAFYLGRATCLVAIFMTCVMVLVGQTHNPFVYFRF